MDLFAGLDIGTGGGRCVVVDENGRRVASASRRWRYRVEAPGLCELEPATAFTSLASATKEAVAKVDRSAVRAIGVTSQRTGIVLIAADGAELHAGPNADGRGSQFGIALEREHGDAVYRANGRLPVMLYLPARLAWFREHRPDVAARVRLALSFSDWMVWRLTGAAATDATQAAEMLVYDLASGAWSADLCARLGVPSGILPRVLAPGAPAGTLRPDAAGALGLPEGIPVVPAGSDTQAAALGLGVMRTGEAAVVAGTTMLVEQVVAAPATDPARRLWISPHLSGGFVAEAHCGEAGAPIDWTAALMSVDHAWLDAAAAGAVPGGGGVVFVDPAPGPVGDFALVRTGGLTFPVPVLALARSREDVARALIESVAFAAASGFGWTSEVAGVPASVAAAGGVTRLETFGRVLATALGRPVRVGTEANASALGAAIVAAAQRFGGVAQAADAMADRGREVPPVPEWAEGTAGAFAVWRERTAHLSQTAMRVSHLARG